MWLTAQVAALTVGAGLGGEQQKAGGSDFPPGRRDPHGPGLLSAAFAGDRQRASMSRLRGLFHVPSPVSLAYSGMGTG